MLSDDHIFQCIRHGYGEDYVQPGSEVYKEKMCGAVDDWHRWYEFPQWFTSMVERLQEEQKAPLSRSGFSLRRLKGWILGFIWPIDSLNTTPRRGWWVFENG